MKAIFPESIDGDLLRLVHLSNAFRMIPGNEPLKAGEVCHADGHAMEEVRRELERQLCCMLTAKQGR